MNLALSNVGSGSVERGRCKCPGTQGRVRCETSTTFVTGRLRKRSGHDCYRVLAGGVGAWRSFVRGRTTPRAHKTPRARNSHRERTKPRERGTPRAHNTSTLRALSRLTQRRKPPNRAHTTASAPHAAAYQPERSARAAHSFRADGGCSWGARTPRPPPHTDVHMQTHCTIGTARRHLRTGALLGRRAPVARLALLHLALLGVFALLRTRMPLRSLSSSHPQR